MPTTAKRPNFLFIITDQHRADHLGAYGNSIVSTPHIDSLARAGFRAERFYVAMPICMPNRATLLTGRMPSVHGVRHNGIELSLEETTFVDVLREAGYRTALVGKTSGRTRTRRPISGTTRVRRSCAPSSWNGSRGRCSPARTPAPTRPPSREPGRRTRYHPDLGR